MPLKGNRKKPVSENVEQQPAATVPEHKTKIAHPPICSAAQSQSLISRPSCNSPLPTPSVCLLRLSPRGCNRRPHRLSS